MKKLALFITLSFIISSCSYNFVGSYSNPVKGISKIYVENIQNLTSEPNLQLYLRSDLINALNLDSKITVVKKDSADGYLFVKIISYDISPSAFESNALTSMYRCTIGIDIYLKNKNGDYIIQNKRLYSYLDYKAQNNISATERAKSIVAKEVLKDLAQIVDNELFINF